jgi:hypothetical protein
MKYSRTLIKSKKVNTKLKEGKMKGIVRKTTISRPYSLWLLLLVAVVMIFKFMSHADNPNRAHYFAKYYWHYNNLKPEFNQALNIIRSAAKDSTFNQNDDIAASPNMSGDLPKTIKVVDATYVYFPAKPVIGINSPIKLERSYHQYFFVKKSLVKQSHRDIDYYEYDVEPYRQLQLYGFKKKKIRSFQISHPQVGHSINESAIDSELELFTQPSQLFGSCKVKQPWSLMFSMAVDAPLKINDVAIAFPLGNRLTVNACQRLVAISLPEQTWKKLQELDWENKLQSDFQTTFSKFYIGEEMSVLAWSSTVFNYLLDFESEKNWELLQKYIDRENQSYNGYVYGLSLQQSEIQKGQRDYRLSWARFNFIFMILMNYILIQSYMRRRAGSPWMKEAFRYMGRDFEAIIFWLPVSVISLIRTWQDFGQKRRKQKRLARQAELEYKENELGLEVLRQKKREKKETDQNMRLQEEKKKAQAHIDELKKRLQYLFDFPFQEYLDNIELPYDLKTGLSDIMELKSISDLRNGFSNEELSNAQTEISRIEIVVAQSVDYLNQLSAEKQKWLDWIDKVSDEAKGNDKLVKIIANCNPKPREYSDDLRRQLKPKEWKKLRYDLESVYSQIPVNF